MRAEDRENRREFRTACRRPAHGAAGAVSHAASVPLATRGNQLLDPKLVDGVKVFEYELWTPDWEWRVHESKFKDYPNYGRARRGHIGLQDHGD